MIIFPISIGLKQIIRNRMNWPNVDDLIIKIHATMIFVRQIQLK